MSRIMKSALMAFALVLTIGVSAVAAEFDYVANYFNTVDLTQPAPKDEAAKVEGEQYVTLGDLDLSTIRNVLRRTAPVSFGLDSDTPAAAPVTYAEPVTYVEPPVAAPVYAAPVIAAPAGLVSSSTNSDCAPCRKKARRW